MFMNYDSDRAVEDFEQAVDNALYVGGRRRIDQALQAATTLFREVRPLIPKVVVMLTAGKQSRDPGFTSLDAASKPLHDLGVRIFVMAIGPDVDTEELTPLVKRPEDIFDLPSFTILAPQAIPTAVKISQRTGEFSH